MTQQRVQPTDKGRACVVVEKFPAKDQNGNNKVDVAGNQVFKNRYATVGRATMWPAKQGMNHPNIEIEIDTVPIGFVAGSLKVVIFWDSEQQNNQVPAPQNVQQPAAQGGYQQPAPNQYAQNRG